MRNKESVTEYLYFLSVKYSVGFDRLFKALANARENLEVACGELTIQCRRKARDYDVFLITSGYKVVAQFFIPKYLLDQPYQIGGPKSIHLSRKALKRDSPEHPKHIVDLRCGMKRINLKARVLDVPKAALVFTRFGEYARVSNAVIADETGAIKLCLWNEKINAVPVDSIVQIENATVTKFRGENQLKLGKSGRLSVIENASFIPSREVEINLLKSSAA
jgi:hypothetical protein